MPAALHGTRRTGAEALRGSGGFSSDNRAPVIFGRRPHVSRHWWPQRDAIPFVLWNSAGLSGLPSPAQPWRGPESSPSRRTGIGGRRRLGSRERSQSRLDKFGTPAHSLRPLERAGQQTPGDRFATMDLVASLAAANELASVGHRRPSPRRGRSQRRLED